MPTGGAQVPGAASGNSSSSCCSHVVLDLVAREETDYSRGLLGSVAPWHFVGGPKPQLMRLVADLSAQKVCRAAFWGGGCA